MDFLRNWAAVVTAFAALGSAIIGIIVATITYRQVRRTTGAGTYFQLEERFYHTDLMRGLRRRAAIELLSPANAVFNAYDDLGDFFDFIGTLVKSGVLDEKMAGSSYYRRATAFWHMGLKRGAIAKARKGKPTRWDDFEYLVNTVERLVARKDKGSKGKLTDDQINILLEQERNLPTMDELQKELWKSEVEVASQA